MFKHSKCTSSLYVHSQQINFGLCIAIAHHGREFCASSYLSLHVAEGLRSIFCSESAKHTILLITTGLPLLAKVNLSPGSWVVKAVEGPIRLQAPIKPEALIHSEKLRHDRYSWHGATYKQKRPGIPPSFTTLPTGTDHLDRQDEENKG